ncbi:U3 small nucleolar ribonucleoprotein MPP10 [Paramicrosporidium saccamoebae]|uniref:U3 small nucleolar ribonucleoprotein MPP10 n=1 Tax=Paramicrosporidium saccamoebae TaxID=1246581 RepID=A0A2H9TNK7_9FUNG|nr:U3 small nucleolar ribonucleoprotein MPP10 [Paramicrosporidium saccamoebae]
MVRSISASMLEEATPLHMSSATRLAPQEHYRPSKNIPQATTEMSRTDRNRKRRQTKLVKKMQRQQSDERARTAARLDPKKKGSLEKREALKTLSKNKNVTILPQVRKDRRNR